MYRVQFVDDEPRVLDGLRRILHAHRTDWDMSFVGTAAEALTRLAEASVDVVVSDMRMPDMDGAEFLERVRERHPQTVRIALSGHSDADLALRAMNVAHVYLSKPCEAPELVAAVQRALRLRASLQDGRLRAIVHQIGRLPSAPRVWMELSRMLDDPRHDSEHLTQLIGRDASLAAKVLQLANSAYFGRAGRATTLSAAVALLGENVVRNLVLSTEAHSAFAPSGTVGGLSLEGEQRHGASVARLAAGLEPGAAWGADAFAAGLLHDLGKLVLATRIPHLYANMLADARHDEGALVELERERLGADHALVGAYLFDLWGLPPRIVEAVARHHDEPESLAGPLDATSAVAWADRLTRGGASATTPPKGVDADRWQVWHALAERFLEEDS